MAKISIEEVQKIFNEKKFDELIEKLLPIVQSVDNNKTTDIPLWNIYYLVGQAYRYKRDFKNSFTCIFSPTCSKFLWISCLFLNFNKLQSYVVVTLMHPKI